MKQFTDLRFRHVYMGLGTILFLVSYILTDPDLALLSSLSFGASTLATVIYLLKTVIYVAMLHISRKALFDYINLEQVYRKATESPAGAGYTMIAVAITMLAISLVITAAVSS
jgi:hypothetical protein